MLSVVINQILFLKYLVFLVFHLKKVLFKTIKQNKICIKKTQLI